MRSEGKAAAVLEWARKWPELDGYLKLNAITTEVGDASLNVVQTDSKTGEYIDGTAMRRWTFQLKIITAWSSGFDPTNALAESLAASWQDWVSEQYPGNVPDWPGAEITGISPQWAGPALNYVYADDGLAEYVIQAVIDYEE